MASRRADRLEVVFAIDVKPCEIVCRLKREMQCTTTVRPEAQDWQPPTLGFNLQVSAP